MNIAIVVIAYNRLDSLKRILKSVSDANYYDITIDLIISVDKSDNDEVKQYVLNFEWTHGLCFREIKEENLGLRRHILSCGDYFDKYNEDALIVLEDDLLVAHDYINYVVETVGKYENNDDVAGISLFSMTRNLHCDAPFTPLKSKYDVFFMKYAQSWGQIWMKKQWKAFYNWYLSNTNYDFKNSTLPYNIRCWKESSWLKYHIAYCFENDKYFVYPYCSLSTNFADAGTHYTESTNKMQVDLLFGTKDLYLLPELGSKDAVYYDTYQENINILNLFEEDVCIDMFGIKDDRLYKKYLLSSKLLNFKIVKSYGRIMRPQEQNIQFDVAGNDIFLYDTGCVTKNSFHNSKINLNRWNFFYNFPNAFKYKVPYIYLHQVFGMLKLVVKCKIKRIFKKTC